ncbi:MAG TPA: hypothetical protein VF759_14170 [Allosphingosinicella sp.]
MSWTALLLGAGAAILIWLVLKLRGGGGRRDLLGPPKAKPRALSREELEQLTEIVGRGESEEALRRLKSAGYDVAQSRRLIWLMTKLAATD